MNATPSRLSAASSNPSRWVEEPSITGIRILLSAVLVATWAVPAVAAETALPPGFSSEIIHVKLREGTDLDLSQMVLPPGLQNAVVSSDKLFKLPKKKLDEIRGKGRGRSGKALPDLNLWFRIILEPGTDAVEFLEGLRSLLDVESAELAPLPPPPPAVTPDFTASQEYLDGAPAGVDARYSWTTPGGSGSGVTIYDIEYSWNQTHEDLSQVYGVPLLISPGDVAVDPFADNNHGTAVLGEIIADNDTKGVTGISWSAKVGMAPPFTLLLGYNLANAILLVVADGVPGDVILIEQQSHVCGGGFGPSEAISSVFDATQIAVANGFVVVAAAGNGSVNLDDQAACGDTFDRTVRDSGAIIVGAGQPPASGADRQREWFSTYGGRVDVQGWGSGVMTTGYGFSYSNADDPADPDSWYTNFFNGTSSASPIVAGAVANLQGIALAQLGAPLTSTQLRTLLVETGSPQLGNAAEHIGPRPDLRQAIAQLVEVVIEVALDIKPGDPNNINPRSRGVIPVAILTTEIFDATTIDSTTVRFGATGTEAASERSALTDVDVDGDIDMILRFKTQATGIQCPDVVASLAGTTFEGREIKGSDSVITVGCQ